MQRKKSNYSGKSVINVYQFMQMCGLFCESKKNVSISHRIMMKKLLLRHRLFPNAVELPNRLPFEKVSQEDVCKGNILLVEDDNGVLLPYRKPMTASIVKQILPNIGTDEPENLRTSAIENLRIGEEILKPGHAKYLVKKSEKMQETEEERLKELLREEREEILEEVTEKKNRILSLQKKHYN